MEVFAYATLLQWKRDLRNKNIFMVYYLIPIIFLILMGAVFSSIQPAMKEVLIQVMTVLAVSTGAILGVPVSLVATYASDVKKSYVVGNIKLWTGVASNFISALLHISIVSIIIYILTPIIFHAERPDNLFTFSFSLLIYMITSIAVGSVLGLYVKDASKLTVYSQLIYLPSMMLSGIMFDSDLLPKAFTLIGKIFPATWGFLSLKSTDIPIKYYIPQFIIFGICSFLIIIRLEIIKKE